MDFDAIFTVDISEFQFFYDEKWAQKYCSGLKSA